MGKTMTFKKDFPSFEKKEIKFHVSNDAVFNGTLIEAIKLVDSDSELLKAIGEICLDKQKVQAAIDKRIPKLHLTSMYGTQLAADITKLLNDLKKELGL